MCCGFAVQARSCLRKHTSRRFLSFWPASLLITHVAEQLGDGAHFTGGGGEQRAQHEEREEQHDDERDGETDDVEREELGKHLGQVPALARERGRDGRKEQ